MVTRREIDAILEIQEAHGNKRVDKDKHDICIKILDDAKSAGVVTSPAKRRALAYLYDEFRRIGGG